MRPAVFLDRDGTMNEEVGYVNHIDRFHVFPWTADSVLRLNHAGILAILVTNQSGVARGYFPEALVQETHCRLQAELARSGASLDGLYYCPHLPDGKVEAYSKTCVCRKPSPGMLQRAAQEFDIDLGSSFVIGDRYQDLSMGFTVGARGGLVMTGYGRGEYLYHKDSWPRKPDCVAANLLEAVDWVLGIALGSAEHIAGR